MFRHATRFPITLRCAAYHLHRAVALGGDGSGCWKVTGRGPLNDYFPLVQEILFLDGKVWQGSEALDQWGLQHLRFPPRADRFRYIGRHELPPHERRLIAPALRTSWPISDMAVTLAPIILLPGSPRVNNFGGKSLPRFLRFFGFLSHDPF